MKNSQVKKAYQELRLWTEGNGSLVVAQELLGDKMGRLSTMLLENGLLNGATKPNPDFTPEEILGCIMLYLAMRHG